PKLQGEFEEGDPSSGRFFVEGKVEVKELSGHLKLFFTDIKLTERVSVKNKGHAEVASPAIAATTTRPITAGSPVTQSPPPDENKIPELHVFLSKKPP